ncbi:uncharacterized protein TNCV_4416911 [Trichonephila clavipes]|uniref:Uncharacterized protein n=1 Tax=Trichonephila clavipes TaxID=2585209 RepID=A0A8X6SCS1_TRICX|nr:uncharacterized protein TNCV_443801 [Trichonephila clavipes]GFY04608.1 uncharacterized protein TNCV_4416911 [Trichonephila clavipes]
MTSCKSVRFNLPPSFQRVEPGEKDYLRDLLREGVDRLRGEFNSLQMHPKTQLSKAVQLFYQCRSKEVTVVYGNLGRLPLILTYFLDFCFSAQESVAVIANWEINSPYQVKHPISSVDFMILVEPYFGYVVQKPSYVKHLIVLTSHLSLSLASCQVKRLHVGASASDICPITSSDPATLLHPPIFHDGKANQVPLKGLVQLDVTQSKSAHEAFLRMLTGHEMLRNRPYTLKISPRDEQRLKIHLRINRVRLLGLQEE